MRAHLQAALSNCNRMQFAPTAANWHRPVRHIWVHTTALTLDTPYCTIPRYRLCATAAAENETSSARWRACFGCAGTSILVLSYRPWRSSPSVGIYGGSGLASRHRDRPSGRSSVAEINLSAGPAVSEVHRLSLGSQLVFISCTPSTLWIDPARGVVYISSRKFIGAVI